MQDWYRIYSIVNTGASYGIDVGPDSSSNKGKGRNYGLEITLERYFNKGYYFLTNVSLLKSQYRAGDGVWRSSVFDIGHVFNFLSGKEFHLDHDNRKLFSIDLKTTWSGGRRYVPIDEQASNAANETKYDFAHAYDKRLKDYFRTDLKISYSVNRPKATHNLFIAADNILNTQNVLEQYWDKDEKKVKTAYQLGIFPYLGYRIQF
jgi:outer membrane receptor protein involved in Fe transport